MLAELIHHLGHLLLHQIIEPRIRKAFPLRGNWSAHEQSRRLARSEHGKACRERQQRFRLLARRLVHELSVHDRPPGRRACSHVQ